MFEYFVQQNGKYDYYLYTDFDSALKKATELSTPNEIGLVYEIAFNTETREFRLQNTFRACRGKVYYDKHGEVKLHVHFYVNSGEWLNPNDEWLTLLQK